MARKRVVVDCSLVGGLTRETRERMRAEAAEAFARGVAEDDEDMVAAARRAVEKLTAAEAEGPAVVVEAFTAEEEAARDAEEAQALERAKAEEKERKETAALVEKLEAGTASAEEQGAALARLLRGGTS
ncbi:MAG: hypothetical protein ACRDL3_08980 [Solirubrobacterales bacterium]